jgi:structural maintenance of chromosome 3 (chondroitin sulfate proteoglycan 6)
MKDSDRLDLLKEVAGTTVYEERRSESIKILHDSNTKQEKITEILEFIDERLHELEEEKNELKDYEDLDKRRRALEYNLYDKELSRATASLEALDAQQEDVRGRQQDLFAALRAAEEELQTAEEELNSQKDAADRTAEIRDVKTAELTAAVARRSRCEVDLQEAQARQKAQEAELSALRRERDELLRAIQEAESALGSVETQYNSEADSLQHAKETHAQIAVRIETLYGKQGRGRNFGSAKERDSFLKSQVSLMQSQLTEKEELIQRLLSELRNHKAVAERERLSIIEAETLNVERQNRAAALTAQIESLLLKRNEFQERRKHIWRQKDEVNFLLINFASAITLYFLSFRAKLLQLKLIKLKAGKCLTPPFPAL